MNFKTTLFLAALVIAGGATWFLLDRNRPEEPDGRTAEILQAIEQEAVKEHINYIKIRRGPNPLVELTRGDGNSWSLPGGWPVRRDMAEQLVNTLAGLRTRFRPIPITTDLAGYGLGGDAMHVTVQVGGQRREFSLGEKANGGNALTRPTYLRRDNVIFRLAPGVLAALDRPASAYQQRRLFPTEKVSEGDSAEKVDRLAASAVEVEKDDKKFELVKKGDDWELSRPVRDRAAPDKVREILAGLGEVWVEDFVSGKKLEDTGLDKPVQTVTVTRPDGGKVELLIGGISDVKTRVVQQPPIQLPGKPPIQPPPERVKEEYRYAKLRGRDQIFQVRADKLNAVALAPEALRDPQLARFSPADVRRAEVVEGPIRLVFTKKDDAWHLAEPLNVSAEREKVTELLGKLAALEARGKDVVDVTDKEDLKKYGLDAPKTIKLTVEESAEKKADKDGAEAKKGDKPKDEKKKVREIVFSVGKVDEGKLYVQVEGWPRVNAVDASLLKLMQRQPLAYRDRRLLDLPLDDVARIEVRHGEGAYTLEQGKAGWKMAAPAKLDVDAAKASKLAADLARLEVVEYVSGAPGEEDLDKVYGLKKPEAVARLEFADGKKKREPVALEIGKQRTGRPEFFARLSSEPTVFVVKKDVRDALTHEALTLLPLELWKLDEDKVKEVKVTRGESGYRLVRDGTAWNLTGPFDAVAETSQAIVFVESLAALKAEKYVALTAEDKHGLATPLLRFEVTQPSEKDKPAVSRVLLVGDKVDKDGPERYGQSPGGGVFVLSGKVVAAIDKSALDLLHRKLLALDEPAIREVQVSGPGRAAFTLKRLKQTWLLDAAGGVEFTPGERELDATLEALRNLRAESFAAYGPKVDLSAYGLDKPAVTLEILVEQGKPAKSRKHTVTLGADAKGKRYARVNGGPEVAALSPATAADLDRTYLDFADRQILKIEPAKIRALKGNLGASAFEARREDGAWKLVNPAGRPADRPTLEALARQLAGLRAQKVAALAAKDFAEFGLDSPAAVITVEAEGEGKSATLHFGKAAPAAAGKREARYVRQAKPDSNTIFIVEMDFAIDPLGSALQLQDRVVARAGEADRVVVERDGRKATFTLIMGDWHLTDPVQAKSEDLPLDDLVKKNLELLRADELVADKAADLKQYGLDKPAVRWQLYQTEKELLTLLVGAEEKSPKGQPRRYAKLASSDVIFLLSPELTKKALAEYRERKPWLPLDAKKADRIILSHGEKALTLIHADGAWRAGGKPEAKVDEQALRDLLDAVEGLEAERYVADSATPDQMKEYGLQPPQMIVALSLPGGKRVLHVGKQEGATGRYFAVVPGPQGTAVFTIAPERARHIVRPAEAFLESKK